MHQAISRLLIIVLRVIRILFKNKNDLITENLAVDAILANHNRINTLLKDVNKIFWAGFGQIGFN